MLLYLLRREARILCHEIDHMDGILAIDRIESEEYVMDITKYKELKEAGKLPQVSED